MVTSPIHVRPCCSLADRQQAQVAQCIKLGQTSINQSYISLLEAIARIQNNQTLSHQYTSLGIARGQTVK